MLADGQSYGNLVGVPPDNAVARDKGLLRVQPNDPANSFLIVKVTGKPPLGEGSKMPLTGTPAHAPSRSRCSRAGSRRGRRTATERAAA